MAKSQEEFHALMEQVLAGSESAAAELFHDFEPYLLTVIRKRLSQRVRSKFDSIDIAQDVWKSFYAAPQPERCFQTQGELIKFLVKLARHKVVDAMRQRLNTEKHDVKRERSLDDSRRFDKNNLADGAQATPSQIMMSQEEWQAFLEDKPLVYQRIFILLREGLSREEIADELQINVKTVHRVVQRFYPRSV